MTLIDHLKKNHETRGSLLDELTEFYKKHKPVVYVYFLQVLGSEQESEELTQETFFQAVKSIHRFRGESSIKTWLLQIARNVYRNRVRKKMRDEQYVVDAEVIDTLADNSSNPQKVLMQRQSMHDIQRIFRQMPEDYRDVLIFKEIEGLSHAEIAAILGKTPQTAKVLLYRAKKKFKELYDQEVGKHEQSL